jgi:hypothetical protein
MADEKQVIRGIDWRETFPFTHLFRSFRIAIHPSKLLLGLAFLILLYVGGRVLDGVWPDKYSVTNEEKAAYGLIDMGDVARAMNDTFGGGHAGGMPDFEAMQRRMAGVGSDNPLARRLESEFGDDNARFGVFITFLKYEIKQLNNAAGAVFDCNWTGWHDRSVVESLWKFVVVGPGWLIKAHWVLAILLGAWLVVLWSVFGGAIARIAAVHVARDEKISIRQALRFSTSKVLSFLFAPIIPAIILLGLAVVLAVGGLLLYVPVIGPIAVGAAFALVLAAAFVMTLVVFGTVGGFNLMYPTVAVEGSDSFDAISRSFSYVFARPWRMLFYTVVALAYGALTYLFVRLFIFIMLALAHCSVGWFLGKNHLPHAYWTGQSVVQDGKTYNDNDGYLWKPPTIQGAGPLSYDVPTEKLKWSEDIAAWLIAFWVYLTIALLGAFAISFYFSSNTIIYYLLRKEVDATEMDDVYVEQADEDFAEPGPESVATVTTTTVVETTTTPVTPTEPPLTPPSDETTPPTA